MRKIQENYALSFVDFLFLLLFKNREPQAELDCLYWW